MHAEKLGRRFAYATNGKHVVEFDYDLGGEHELETFTCAVSTCLLPPVLTPAGSPSPYAQRKQTTPPSTEPDLKKGAMHLAN